MVAIFYRITRKGVVVDNKGDYVFINRGKVDEVLVDFTRMKIVANVRYKVYHYHIKWGFGHVFDTDDWGVHVNLYSQIPLVFVESGYPISQIPEGMLNAVIKTHERMGPYIIDDKMRKVRVGGLDGREVAKAVGNFIEVYNPRWFVVV